ncbi:MAG TPA: hypothetical protein VHQ45_03585 [Gemmatimonadaceae bacterium]|nr:hypothetical protein [Gemmatimonadaceae bacterium]
MITPRPSEAHIARSSAHSPVERAEELLGRLGERVGGSAANATRRVRRTADTTADGRARPALDRADEVVNRMEEIVGVYATVLGRRLQRLAARAREEAEDMWAEAQHLRSERQRAAAAPPEKRDGRAD